VKSNGNKTTLTDGSVEECLAHINSVLFGEEKG